MCCTYRKQQIWENFSSAGSSASSLRRGRRSDPLSASQRLALRCWLSSRRRPILGQLFGSAPWEASWVREVLSKSRDTSEGCFSNTSDGFYDKKYYEEIYSHAGILGEDFCECFSKRSCWSQIASLKFFNVISNIFDYRPPRWHHEDLKNLLKALY